MPGPLRRVTGSREAGPYDFTHRAPPPVVTSAYKAVRLGRI